VTFEVTQEIKRVGTFNAESDSEALVMAKQKFAKSFGYIEDIRYTIKPVAQVEQRVYTEPDRAETLRKDHSR